MHPLNTPVMNIVPSTANIRIDTTDQEIKDENDLSTILQQYDIKYISSGYYWKVGESLQKEGWIIHVSVVRQQAFSIAKAIIPILKRENICFAIAKNIKVIRYILDGNFGYEHIGKIISIYPTNDAQADLLSKLLLPLVINFKGPQIPNTIKLSSILYAEYQSINLQDNDQSPKKHVFNKIHKNWPFSEFPTTSNIAFRPSPKLLNNTYKPIEILKPDAKGRVIKSLYIKGVFKIKSCILKEGKRNMWADDFGRDMRDRLIWQQIIYKDLSATILLPRIFDSFQENDDMFIVMDFIKGKSLENIISSFYHGNCWPSLANKNKISIIDYLLRIIDIITLLHKSGYIHRDITPANFIIDKKNRIFLIDMELSYSIHQKKPTPPFELGTIGFISPEQEAVKVPTIKEDIYGIGALMIVFFTNLPPVKYNIHSKENLKEGLFFYTQTESLSTLITSCLNANPLERPTLENIKQNICLYKEQVIAAPISEVLKKNNFQSDYLLKQIIELAINGLKSDIMLGKSGIWGSEDVVKKDKIVDKSMEREYFCGLHTGISGILFLLARASFSGYNIDNCKKIYLDNFTYLKNSYLSMLSKIPQGLYHGSAGLALSISYGINSNLLNQNPDLILNLSLCFQTKSPFLSVAFGISGQLLALQQCKQLLVGFNTEDILTQYVTAIINAQQSDGSWKTEMGEEKEKKQLGFSYGVSGILYSLLNYATLKPTIEIIESIQKGLKWLAKSSNKIYNLNPQNFKIEKDINNWNPTFGIPGIAVCFIKAYEYFKDPTYKQYAGTLLYKIPASLNLVDFTQANGLSGIGEVYLEAYKTFGDLEWKKRADWIANIFTYTFLKNDQEFGHWSMNANNSSTADFMVGNCGIIHFLIRCSNCPQLGYLFYDHKY